eukprot:CAMPEP_0185391156 /NCGR_PEP_ID=MMETSP1364-20130426/73866_1 /TAXON_ID=38817 /ORGANISM="Gephyrocapsa oceanica, Strain RCC1303" /LENGTH=112 /DNA_ID=CAMNT_0027993163 /DNA_START=237 /DNA_END=576 /DNA_ORIENTATION=-
MSPRLARRQAAHQAAAANPRSPPTAASASRGRAIPGSTRDTPEGSEGGPHDGHGSHTEEKDSLAELKAEKVLELVLREGFCAPTQSIAAELLIAQRRRLQRVYCPLLVQRSL